MIINFTLFGADLTGGNFNLIEVANRLAKRGHKIIVTSIGSPKDLAWFKNQQFKTNFSILASKFIYRLYRMALKTTILHPFPEIEIRDLIRSMPLCEVNIATAWPTTFAVHRSGKGKGFYYIQHYDSLLQEDQVANNIHDESYFLPLSKISVSSWLKNVIKERLGVEVKSVITAGVDEGIFYPRPHHNKTIRIISLGRKIPWKGFRDLEESISLLLKEGREIEWVVFSSHDTPESKADAPFTLIKSPYGKDLAELYASCDIAVNPSWHEGFSQPALEAMASGCAVITTPIGAEDFARDKENCLLIPPKDALQIKDSMVKLIDDKNLRASLIEGGIRTAKNFYWDKIINKWEENLNE